MGRKGARGRHGIASFPQILTENPYQRLLYGALAEHGYTVVADAHFGIRWMLRHRQSVGAVHFHWPQGYWRHGPGGSSAWSWLKLMLFAVRLVVARVSGFRIVWTVHQVSPHESPRPALDRTGARILARLAHVLIAHDAATARQVERLLGVHHGRVAIVPHGPYADTYPQGRSRTEVRQELRLDDADVAFLCFGHLRGYKGIGMLLDALEDAPAGAAFVIAGMPMDAAAEEAVREAAARDPRLRLRLGFVPDEQVAELFCACDVALCSRSDGGTSGVLMLALTMGIPVVAADHPTYRAMADDGHAGWWFSPGDPASLAETIGRVVEAAPDELARRAESARRAAAKPSWAEVAARTASLLGRPGAATAQRLPQPA
jgi:glycosyltransferase involved in cell wall biosynthesis